METITLRSFKAQENKLLLKIIVGCLVAIGIAVLIGGLIFLYFCRQFLKDCLSDNTTPLTIHLHEDLTPEWLHDKGAKSLIKEFTDLGFTTGKAYVIEEMEQVQMVSLFHPQFAGVIYNVEELGFSFDVVYESVDGSAFTVTTAPFAEVFDSPPNKEKLHKEGICVREAFRLAQNQLGNLGVKKIDDENFRDIVESYYKEEQAYRNRNGGVSLDEFQQIAAKDKKKHSQNKIEEAFFDFKVSELDRWNDAGIEEYFEKNEGSIEDQYENGGCYFIVPQKTYPKAFVQYLSDLDLITEEKIESYVESANDDDNIVELFDRINTARSKELRAVERGSITFPVEAKVYQQAGW